jgi:hypothetical protein
METNQKNQEKSESKKPRAILPADGIWTVEDLARWLGMASTLVQQKLSDNGVKVLSFSSRYKHKLIRLEDLRELPNVPEE